MVRHITLCEDRYRDPASCIEGIRGRIEVGWHIVEIHGTNRGPLTVTYAMAVHSADSQPSAEGA